ncbi:hypothetical protein TREMEDRAFT_11865, partial [Tremella mesenterica DSM 1558]|uniref:uncharacterized protein n=1 Tax=Tremella mesenterica (strain ATCC 24925 / CBS 8224 / DSM 1558 / NBRC 9311 / NRRL Y-6157 / RJB 2259-6 / UBC 559-6) TaxID=578456 RepID=UPI00032D45CF
PKDKSDWSWVGTEVLKVEDITPLHRRRAAGLEGATQCPIRWQHDTSEIVKPIEITNGEKCTPARCRGKVKCYNHLGAEEVFEEKTKDRLLRESLPDNMEIRDGPAGLRNLGATCYANAFLQVWYYDIPFRRAVYASVTEEDTTTPLYHLAQVFASLQLSKRPYIDPSPLVEVLQLDKADQQDAAEFAKLFMELITPDVQIHPQSKLRSLISDQYEGIMEYVTTCECGYQSRRPSTFRELELSLKSKSTLDEHIKTFLRPELLNGQNQYSCPICKRLRDATRKTELVKLPPVLQITLMRFIFDYKTESRKKSNVPIEYSTSLKIEDQEYELQAVISHQGSSAHHGHFTCEVYSSEDDDWLFCNDEEVTLRSSRPNKRMRQGSNEVIIQAEKTTKSSKDAYMLVYKRKRSRSDLINGHQAIASSHVQPLPVTSVKDEMAAMAKEASNGDVQCHNGDKGLSDLATAILPPDEVIVPRDALSKWFKTTQLDELSTPLDFEPVKCSHGAIDPIKTPDCRLISRQAWDRISSHPTLDICETCVKEGFNRRLAEMEHRNQVVVFNELIGEEGEYLLPSRWLQDWDNSICTPPDLPNHPNYELLCDHGELFPTLPNTLSISVEALQYLRSLFENLDLPRIDTPICLVCEENRPSSKVVKVHNDDVTYDRKLKREVDAAPMIFDEEFYVLPEEFYTNWSNYIKGQAGKPVMERMTCKHGGLDIDPTTESLEYISSSGWQFLSEKYGTQSPVIVKFGANRLEGASTSVIQFSPPICDPCRLRR